MIRVKSLFGVLVVAVAFGGPLAAVGAMVQMGGVTTDQPQDERVVLGHRIGPNGQEILIYAE